MLDFTMPVTAHADLKDTNILLERIACSLEILVYHSCDQIVPGSHLEKKREAASVEGTEISFYDHDKEAVEEALRAMNINPDDPDKEV